MLRRLVRETNAIAALREVETTDAYAKALGQAAMGPVRGVQSLVEEPVETVKAVPGAIFDLFARAGEAVSTAVSGSKTAYEDSGAAQLLQMSSYKRDYAKKLGVDPYSSNPVLQEELNSVAWAAAAGGLTIGALTMASGSAVVQAASYARNLDQARDIVAAEPPAELTRRNRAALAKMGIDKSLADRFLAQRQYSPRHKTILVAALAALDGAKGRKNLIEVALEAPNEEMALFYQQVAELLDGYDERVARITRLERFNRQVVAYDRNGKAVLLAPLDYIIWNEQVAAAARKIAKSMQLKPGSGRFELWIAGTASPRFKTEAAALGITVRERVTAQLPLLD